MPLGDKKRQVNPNSLANLRPPWKPGDNPNPKGRPKGSDCLISCIKKELERKVRGQTQTNEQLIAEALISRAKRGDLKAIELVLAYTVAKPESDKKITGDITLRIVES